MSKDPFKVHSRARYSETRAEYSETRARGARKFVLTVRWVLVLVLGVVGAFFVPMIPAAAWPGIGAVAIGILGLGVVLFLALLVGFLISCYVEERGIYKSAKKHGVVEDE